MKTRSLEDLIGDAGGPLNLLRAHTYDHAGSNGVFFAAADNPADPAGIFALGA